MTSIFRFAAVLLLAASALAQTPTGEISGVIRDPSGAAVPGATVSLTNENTGLTRETNTNEDGIYAAALLPPGIYSASVQSAGFRVSERAGLELSALQSLRVDFSLELGDITETITVTAEAVQVDTRTASQGMLVDDRRVRDLPLNGRNVTDLARLIPGLNRINTTFTANFSQQRLFLNGTRDTSVAFLMDGSSVNYSHRGRGLNLPPPDAVQEFKVLTGGIDAEYGRGANVMSAVTRSGTNELHGSLWNFFRNDALDARNFFAAEVPKLRFNQYGATAGGPIRKNRTFFFGSFQGLRIREDDLSTGAFPPTQAELNGDFSQSGAVITDPQTGDPFPNNQIPRDRFDPVAQRLLEFVQAPNRPDGSYVEQASASNNGDQFMGRVDHQLTSRNQLTGRYFHDFNRGLEPFSGSDFTGYNGEQNQYRQQTLTIEDSHFFGSRIIQTARFTFNRFDYQENNTEEGDLTTFGATDFVHSGGPRNTRPIIGVSGRFQLGVGRDRQRLHDNWGFADTVAVSSGDHQLKFGFTVENNRFFYQDNNDSGADFDFNGSRTGEPLADYLQGLPRRFDQASPFATNQKYTYMGVFAQDNWRVLPRLTASLGLRAEIFNAWREDDGQISSYVAGAQSSRFPTAPLGLIFQGDDGFPYERDANNLGPRAGLAWDVFGDGRTAVRSSFGLYYDALTAEMAGGVSAPQPFGLTLRVNRPQSLSQPYGGRSNPFPFTVDPANAEFVTPVQIDKAFNPDVQNPYIMSWTLGVQQQLPADLLFDIAYVGNGGRHQILIREQNPAIFGPGATEGNTNSRRPLFPNFGSIGQLNSDGISYYHALQTQLNKRFSKGLSFSANYTWSKTIDEGGTGNSFANEGQQNYQSPFDRRLERGPSTIDLRHRFAASFLYELPFLKGGSGWLRTAFGGWEIGGITTLQTGRPVELLTGQDNSLSGVGNDRPDVIGDPELWSDRPREQLIEQWFNTSAFAANQIGRFGTAGRGIVYGPGDLNIDLSLRKSFRITESQSLQFRWEAFNALNRVNLGDPEGEFDNRGFGRITSAGSARIMQLSLKYMF